ncbi:uncharacterized protein [Argopecten irradians]|uniref:uncharacterized protein n=1 Tax=Argopecten irradians TaxID=31199 RepID=UPI0037100DBD
MDTSLCIECERPVTTRQQALQCDGCDQWQHRLCKTGISQTVYRATMRGDPCGLQTWYCSHCPCPGTSGTTSSQRSPRLTESSAVRPAWKEKPLSPASLPVSSASSPVSPASSPVSLVSSPVSSASSLVSPASSPVSSASSPVSPSSSTMSPVLSIVSPVCVLSTVSLWPVTPTVSVSPVTPTFVSAASVDKRLVMMDSSSSSDECDEADETNPKTVPIIRPFDFLKLVSRFPWKDTTEHHNILDDQSRRQMDKAFLEEDSDEDTWTSNMRTDMCSDETEEEDGILYDIIENSKRHRVLISSEGYSYTLQKSSSGTTTWGCSVRNKSVYCSASVTQRGESFTRGIAVHIHPPNRFLAKKLNIISMVKRRALSETHLSASAIVKGVLRKLKVTDTHRLPNPVSLVRIVHRCRRKVNH